MASTANIPTYSVIIRTAHTNNFAFIIDMASILRIVEAYNAGSKDIFINGKKIFMTDLWEIKIFSHKEHDNLEGFKKTPAYQNFTRANPMLNKGVVDFHSSHELLISTGEEVTTEFIKGNFGQLAKTDVVNKLVKKAKIFIGHGRSKDWLEVERFLEKELGLSAFAFETESRTSQQIIDILKNMLEDASHAILILTGEDETPQSLKRARQNVIHEAGLFQGKLGFEKVVLLKEENVEEFSNVHGLQYISFRKGQIDDTFTELRKYLTKEGALSKEKA